MQDISVYFRALSDRKRLRIAEYLSHHDDVPVTQLGAELRLSQPLISWHLRVLRRAGVVRTKRTGRQVLCSLNRRSLEAYSRRVDALFGLDVPDGDLAAERHSGSLRAVRQTQ